jgi:Microtubule binding
VWVLQVFEDTKHLVRSAVDGYNVCIFAYGQTGSGVHTDLQGLLTTHSCRIRCSHASSPVQCNSILQLGVRAGKTHTMAGNPAAPGLAPRGVEELFRGSQSAVMACYGHEHALRCVHNSTCSSSQPPHR